MSKRVILISGANGGLGQGIARAFLNESPENIVLLGVRAGREHADKLAAETPDRCRCVDLDVTSLESWRTVMVGIQMTDHRIDVLVNNAGTHQDGLLANLTPQAWNDVIATNLTSTFFGCQTVIPYMISQKHGRIVNISSLSALLAPAGQTNYAAAKAGVVALTQSLAKEVARLSVTVNVICPGYIDTGALTTMPSEELRQAILRVPMRRIGRPEEVAAAVRFLASAEASYITGSILKVDGGIL